MRRSSLTTLLYLMLVFVSGIVLGAFANRLYMMKSVSASSLQPKTRAEFRKEYIKEMRTRLNLTPPQIASLLEIIQATDHRLHDMHKTIDEEHAQKIFAMLNDTQKAEYAKMRDEREKARQQKAQKGL